MTSGLDEFALLSMMNSDNTSRMVDNLMSGHRENLRGKIASLQATVAKQCELLELKQQQLALANTQRATNKTIIKHLEYIIADKEAELESANKRLLETAEQHQKYRKYLERQISHIQDTCAAGYSNLEAYERIYTLLVQEIYRIDDPSRYQSLDPKTRLKAMKEVWDKNRATKQLVHHPDLTFSFEDEAKKEVEANRSANSQN